MRFTILQEHDSKERRTVAATKNSVKRTMYKRIRLCQLKLCNKINRSNTFDERNIHVQQIVK